MIELQPSGVTFIKGTHQYFRDSDGKELRGITSTLVAAAFPHDYDDIDPEVLRKAAERGTRIHEAIEDYEDKDAFSVFPELDGYIAIKAGHHLAHERSEYIVTDGEEFASAIDLVMTDENGGIVLADIKTTYDKHYEKVALQLSIYKRFFERQNPGKRVSKIALIWLRGDKSEYRELHPWAEEALDALFAAVGRGETFSVTATYGDLPRLFASAEDEVARRVAVMEEAKEWLDSFKAGIYKLMEEKDVKSWKGDVVGLTRVLPTETTKFDSAAFKKDHPDLYKQYCKKTTRAGSLQIRINNK